MKKRTAGLLLGVLACSMLLSACGENKATEAVNESEAVEKEGSGEALEAEQEKEENNGEAEAEAEALEPEEPALKVGVLLPEEEGRWSEDQRFLEEKLTEAGYEPVILNAGNDAGVQSGQVLRLVEEEISALIVAPVDVYGLTEALAAAEEKSVPVFSYDTLIRDTPVVNYYATFDTRAAGRMTAENIVNLMELEKARENKLSYTIEFLMGSPEESSELFFYNGIMEVLQEYLDDGTLVCKSGKTAFDDTSVMRRSENAAKNRMNSILTEFYAEEGAPDIICNAADAYTCGITELLDERGILPDGGSWPLITGVGSEAETVKQIAEGKIAFTLFMDREELADACVTLVNTYLTGGQPEVKDYAQYDNGKKVIGTATCEAELIDGDNYQILIDSGVYTAEEIEPEKPAPLPEKLPVEEPVEKEPETEAQAPKYIFS